MQIAQWGTGQSSARLYKSSRMHYKNKRKSKKKAKKEKHHSYLLYFSPLCFLFFLAFFRTSHQLLRSEFEVKEFIFETHIWRLFLFPLLFG